MMMCTSSTGPVGLMSAAALAHPAPHKKPRTRSKVFPPACLPRDMLGQIKLLYATVTAPLTPLQWLGVLPCTIYRQLAVRTRARWAH